MQYQKTIQVAEYEQDVNGTRPNINVDAMVLLMQYFAHVGATTAYDRARPRAGRKQC